ncbi:MAG: hypothetical protein IKL10_03055 [Clostridia bacterium]|nr:hypothetical protein [Clostridia bacterium]
MVSFSAPEIIYHTSEEKHAATILSDEINMRINCSEITEYDFRIIFSQNSDFTSPDDFSVLIEEKQIIFSASGIRGFIFAIGLFLRKCSVTENTISLLWNISGKYTPDKKIRGHQVGYRQTSNTYDAWDIPEYRRCYLDMMYFGVNTCEHIPYENGTSNRNSIMRRDEQELLYAAAKEADDLGLDVSVWYPNCEKDIETAIKNREELFSKAERLDYIFPPGGDPGDIQPEELMTRCKEFREILKKYHPTAGMWPSAQQPHQFPDWGTKFLWEMKKMPDFIDGVITGPNAAFPLDILRRHLPQKYPIRLYPDITHNLRCEYPVHFDRDDWHYALQTANGRESINPRPTEYKKIHADTRGYVIGSVSYSEGVNDDINKAVWSALDFDPDTPVREILEDYSRLFFHGTDFEKAADGIFGLEKNWEGAPEENPCIENTLKLWEELGNENKQLLSNWRYIQCLFRARCDAFVRRRILFENSLITQAKRIALSDIKKAEEILRTPLPENISELKKQIEENGKQLFDLIGMQLDVSNYHAKNFERGAVLDTIKLPVTDLPWLLNCFEKAENLNDDEKTAYIIRCFNRNKVEKDEYYYSVALHGLNPGGVKQNSGFYMNIQADRPDKNNGTLPTSLFKLFDHFSFRLKTGGLKYDTDYILQITYRDSNNEDSKNHRVLVNGHCVFCGQQFGGTRNYDYEQDMLPDGFIAVEYNIPAQFIINGCIDLSITEKVNGFEIAELRLTKKSYKSISGGNV